MHQLAAVEADVLIPSTFSLQVLLMLLKIHREAKEGPRSDMALCEKPQQRLRGLRINDWSSEETYSVDVQPESSKGPPSHSSSVHSIETHNQDPDKLSTTDIVMPWIKAMTTTALNVIDKQLTRARDLFLEVQVQSTEFRIRAQQQRKVLEHLRAKLASSDDKFVRSIREHDTEQVTLPISTLSKMLNVSSELRDEIGREEAECEETELSLGQTEMRLLKINDFIVETKRLLEQPEKADMLLLETQLDHLAEDETESHISYETSSTELEHPVQPSTYQEPTNYILSSHDENAVEKAAKMSTISDFAQRGFKKGDIHPTNSDDDHAEDGSNEPSVRYESISHFPNLEPFGYADRSPRSNGHYTDIGETCSLRSFLGKDVLFSGLETQQESSELREHYTDVWLQHRFVTSRW
jgi:hypothetical protein